MKRLYLILIQVLCIVATTYAQNRHDYLIFIGEVEQPRLVKEGKVVSDEKNITMYHSQYIVNSSICTMLYGDYKNDTVEFCMFDEYRPASWPNNKYELCILYKDDLLPEYGYIAQFSPMYKLFKTVDGEYILDYAYYSYLMGISYFTDYFKKDCQKVEVGQDEYAIDKVSPNMVKRPYHVDLYPDEYYKRDGDKVYPTYGVSLDVFTKRYVKFKNLPRKGIAD